mgnify:CR=1 FL=1
MNDSHTMEQFFKRGAFNDDLLNHLIDARDVSHANDMLSVDIRYDDLLRIINCLVSEDMECDLYSYSVLALAQQKRAEAVFKTTSEARQEVLT